MLDKVVSQGVLKYVSFCACSCISLTKSILSSCYIILITE